MILPPRKDFVCLKNIVDDVIIFFSASLSDSKYFYVEGEIPTCIACARARARRQQLNNTRQLIYLIPSSEVSIEFVAQSSNFTLSSSSSLPRCRGERDRTGHCRQRISLAAQISAQKYTFAKSADRSGMSTNRKSLFPFGRYPTFRRHVPSPLRRPFSFSRSRLSRRRPFVTFKYAQRSERTVESLFA